MWGKTYFDVEKHCVSWEPIKKSEDQEVDYTSLLYSMIDGFIKSSVHLADRMTGPVCREEILLLQERHNCHRNICFDSVSPTIVFFLLSCSQIHAYGCTSRAS